MNYWIKGEQLFFSDDLKDIFCRRRKKSLEKLAKFRKFGQYYEFFSSFGGQQKGLLPPLWKIFLCRFAWIGTWKKIKKLRKCGKFVLTPTLLFRKFYFLFLFFSNESSLSLIFLYREIVHKINTGPNFWRMVYFIIWIQKYLFDREGSRIKERVGQHSINYLSTNHK